MQEPKTGNTLTKEPVSLEEKLQSKIAFTSTIDGNREIYVMNVDGSKQKNLTNNPAQDISPSWPPFLPCGNKTNEKK